MGKKVYTDYIFTDPADREFRGEFKDGFNVQTYKLVGSGEVALPIQDMLFKVLWLDGRPEERARIMILDIETGKKFEA